MTIQHQHVKLDLDRPGINATKYEDLEILVGATFLTYRKLETLLSAYSARQCQREEFLPPDRDWIIENVKASPNINEVIFSNMVNGAVSFYRTNKSKQRLPLADPATHHSVHFSEGLFSIKPLAVERYLDLFRDQVGRRYKPSNAFQIDLCGCGSPIYIENLSEADFKYLIVRPKMTKTGISVSNWEILLFKKNHGYLIDHVDANVNPRYVGKL